MSIDPEYYVLKVDVDLMGLPNIQYGSNEVIVDFHVPSINNNGTMWVDSNGLEMQKKILNYRVGWDL